MITQKIRGHVVALAFEKFLGKDSKVLDIGCGNGIITSLLKKRFGCDIRGTDVLDYASASGIEFKKMDSPTELPFADASFDFALLVDVLHHTRDQKAVLDEAARVAKRILVFDIEPGFSTWFLDVFVNYIINREIERTFTHRTIRGWSDFFSGAGYALERINFKKPLWYPLPQFAFVLEKK